MGLLFILPTSEAEVDRIKIKDNSITLKTYGLPMIFWGYLMAVLTIIAAMVLTSYRPIITLYHTQDALNQILAVSATLTIIIIPLATISFYFYEKFIIKENNKLTIIHRLFYIPLVKKSYLLDSREAFKILHHMDSPNIAKIKSNPDMKGFENKGYFQLFAINSDHKSIFLDRSSRKSDLKKIQDLFSKY